MLDGKRSTAEKILYEALEKIKLKKAKMTLLKVFNMAINNVKPNVSVGLEELEAQHIKFGRSENKKGASFSFKMANGSD